jgi:hypothetical protein
MRLPWRVLLTDCPTPYTNGAAVTLRPGSSVTGDLAASLLAPFSLAPVSSDAASSAPSLPPHRNYLLEPHPQRVFLFISRTENANCGPAQLRLDGDAG